MGPIRIYGLLFGAAPGQLLWLHYLCYNSSAAHPAQRDLMPGYRHIILGKNPSDHIAWLTLNRPERRNAIDDVTIAWPQIDR